jgi:hypothetical protein
LDGGSGDALGDQRAGHIGVDALPEAVNVSNGPLDTRFGFPIGIEACGSQGVQKVHSIGALGPPTLQGDNDMGSRGGWRHHA